MLLSCSKQGTESAFDYDDYRGDNLPPIANSEKFIPSVHISPTLDGEFAAALKLRSSVAAEDASDAEVVVTGMAELSSVKRGSSVSGKQNAIHIVLAPSADLIEELGVEMSVPLDSVLCVAFRSGHPGCCTVRKPLGALTVNDCLNGLVDWVNSVRLADTQASPDNPLSYVYNVVNHTYHKYLEDEITHVILSKPDRLKGNVTVNTRIDVTPLHGFSASYEGKGMDYYLVSSCISIESGTMYSGNFTKKHGGVKARICGYYLRAFSYTVEILDKSNQSIGTFIEVPTPSTAIGSSDYTTGWSFSASGSITGGTIPAATLGLGLSASSSTTRSISDCDIVNRHSGSAVIFDFDINNLPHYKSSIAISSPPDIAVSTANLYSQWIWAVPTADGDASSQYRIRVKQNRLEYWANYMYSSGADFHTKKYPLESDTFSADLPKPNRVATGKFCLTNTSDGTYLTDISLKESGTGQVYTNSGQYDYDKTYSLYLPVGDYELTCTVKGADNVKRKVKYADVVRITAGAETKLSSGYEGFKVIQ